MKKSLLILPIALILIILNSIPNFWSEVYYHYQRFKNGTTMNLGGQCYAVPDRWVILEQGIHKGRYIYDLLSKQDGKYISSSISRADASLIPNSNDLDSIQFKQDRFTIYEAKGLPKENELRYWSFISDDDLIILGTSVENLKKISASIKHIDCS